MEPPPGFDPYLTPEQRADRAQRDLALAAGLPDPALGRPNESQWPGDASGADASAALAQAAAALPEAGDTPTAEAIAQAEASRQWSIVLAVFRGPRAEPLAREALAQTQAAGLSQLAGGPYLERRGETIALALGRFDQFDDPSAQEALTQVQGLSIDGVRPFGAAVLAPPSPDMLGGRVPQYDLRTVKDRFGDDAIYTLQVGVYGRADRDTPQAAELAEYRQAAERAVIDLRRQGEQAFYYHAPLRSMVTIGVFGPGDHDPLTPGVESDRLRETRLRHPNNLLNGQGIRERIRGRPENDPNAWKLQPSALVAVPRS